MTNQKRIIGVAAVLLLVVLLVSAGITAWRFSHPEPQTNTTEVESNAAIKAKYVIHVSIDGLRSDFVSPTTTPTLYGLVKEGAATLNARTDPDFTDTLPNHTSQFTGRPVLGDSGHKVDYNEDKGRAAHTDAGFYLSSVFDVVHDHNGSTIVLADKPKFDAIERTWNDEGGQDKTGADNGTNKIDYYNNSQSKITLATLTDFITKNAAPVFAFYHIKEPDTAGHASGWNSTEYRKAVEEADTILKQLIDELAKTSLADETAIIVSSDHGGVAGQKHHGDTDDQGNYIVPLVIYGPGVSRGADLYELSSDDRFEPGLEQVEINSPQPIRTAEVANVALELLGLPPVPGSIFNFKQDLDY